MAAPNTPERLRATWRDKYAEVMGCHEWLGKRNSGNYGMVRVLGRFVRSHRVAYELFVGPIPEGQVVRHRCDNPGCVNPDHLQVGSQGENMQDKRVRGRARGGYGGGRPKKLTDPLWRIFLKRLKDTGLSYDRLGRKFGVSPQTIRRTITNRR